MTRKQLVDALTANFKEDEEVTFVYNDEHGEVRETRAKVTDHTETYCNGHYEFQESATGKWIRLSDEEYRDTIRGKINKGRIAYCQGRLVMKFVSDGPEIEDTKKVVYIG